MSYILSKEDIDFVVINGDLVTGERTQKADSSKYIDSVVSPLVDKGYRWASTYGNHDSAVNLNPKDDMFNAEQKYPNSLTQSSISGDKAGITNYYLPVFSHGQANTSTPALLLWFFDSRGGRYYKKQGESGPPVKRPSWIDESVANP
jgi:DNA repair exonuclease SbcCD nuclease subunit